MHALFDAHFDAVRAYCIRRLPLAEANDATSEVFLVAWRRLENIPHDAERPWLLRTAYNVIAHARRAHARRGRLRSKLSGLADSPESGPETQVVRSVEQAEVAEAIEQLRAADREVVKLRAWDELSTSEIAIVLDITVEAAKKRVQRAMRRLADQLGEELESLHEAGGGER